MTVVILSAAEEELIEAREYHDRQRQGLGTDFVDAFNEAIERIIAFPEAWGLIANKVRCCIFKKFEYGVIYVVRGENIFVLAIMHMKRRPAYWKTRLRDLGK